MIRREDDGYWIELKEIVGVHHEDVFAGLTTEAGLMRWFSVAAKVDLRAGGLLVLGWDAKFEHKSTVAILDHNPGGTVVWDWHAAHQDTHAPVYWTVEPAVEEGSIVRLRQGPFKADEDSLVAMADEASSWQRRLCNLRSTLEAGYDMRSVRPI